MVCCKSFGHVSGCGYVCEGVYNWMGYVRVWGTHLDGKRVLESEYI